MFLHRRVFQVVNKNKQIFSITSRENSTEKNILKSIHNDIEKPSQTVNEFVWHTLDRWPDKTFTVCAVSGRGYTYAQTHRMSVNFAASLLKKLKLQHNDKVAVILTNVPEYPSVALGILEAGCVASTMNPAYTVGELKHQINLVECKAIVTSKLSYPNVSKALLELKLNIPVILIDNEDLPENTIKFAELIENTDTDILKSVRRSIKDVAILPFSSGTTGFPKAVELTHESITAVNHMILTPRIIAVQEATGSYQAVLPALLPFFHIFGFNVLMLNMMSRGAKLVTVPAFKPDLFLETLVRHKADHLYVVPPMAIFLGKHPAVTPRHLDTVIDILCGAAPLSANDALAIVNKKKDILFRQGYGLTETNGGAAIGFTDNRNYDSIGIPFASSEVKIADLKTGEALGPGEEGEIWYRGPNVMNGYYKNEAATKEVLTEDGWFKTGDIGKYDDEKHLYITDRLKELIKVKGFQVAPAELEKVLRTHPKVLDCAVIGIPDSISGEVPKAFVVVQAGQNLETEEILEHVNSKVVNFKNIKEVQFVEEIPKNPAGKILRKNLKAKYLKDILFRQGYGLTETNGGAAIGFTDNRNYDSIGIPFASSEVKIADLKTGEALGPGEEGEIWYRGPNVMNGYYKNEAATKEVLTEDGWFKTGDIGKYDDEKHLYITDRLKELIKVKGFQVAPAELEKVLRTHPKVLDCAVIGIPDSISGEVPKAFVVVQAGQNLETEEILEHVNSKVVNFKNIKEVQFVEEIPKNPAGKILRKNLKAKYL